MSGIGSEERVLAERAVQGDTEVDGRLGRIVHGGELVRELGGDGIGERAAGGDHVLVGHIGQLVRLRVVAGRVRVDGASEVRDVVVELGFEDVRGQIRRAGEERREVARVAGEILACLGLLGVVLGRSRDRVVDEEADVCAPQFEEGRLGLVAEYRPDRVAEGDGVRFECLSGSLEIFPPSRPRWVVSDASSACCPRPLASAKRRSADGPLVVGVIASGAMEWAMLGSVDGAMVASTDGAVVGVVVAPPPVQAATRIAVLSVLSARVLSFTGMGSPCLGAGCHASNGRTRMTAGIRPRPPKG